MNYKNMGSSLEAKDSLARQLSVYSLTFDEFQTTIGGPGKDFGSMNMDEFLKNIWTAEESYAMGSASVPGGLEIAKTDGGLQRQGSLTLPRTLSQKTVDEVWRGLLGGQPEFQQERQPTLGEMTLEEFLVKAGVVREDMNQSAAGPIINNGNNSVFYSELPSNSNPGLALGFAQPNSLANVSAAMTRAYPVPLSIGNDGELASPQGMRGGGMVGIRDSVLNNGLMSGVVGLGGSRVTVAAAASPVNQVLSDGLMKGNDDLSSLSPVPYVFSGGMKRRKCSGAVEKVVERRQKRMIKNRESAARSRARKQAYTMELEAEVAKLKDKNEELEKKQVEIMEMQKNQVLEMINQKHLPKKRCLRRTQTGPW